jgi:hypothetical protein
MFNNVLNEVLKFKNKYPITLAFRVKSHSKVIQTHLDEGENLKYVFMGQKNETNFQFPNTYVIALTNKRMLLGRKRLLFGYFFYAITPDMLNDVKVKANLIWGKIVIDTIKELVTISNLSRNSLDEIETAITKYMVEEKNSKK